MTLLSGSMIWKMASGGMAEKVPSRDVAKDMLAQILLLAHNALSWGEDKEQTLKKIETLATSAHDTLRVKEVVRGRKR